MKCYDNIILIVKKLDAAMKIASHEVAETLKQGFYSRAVKLKAQVTKLRQYCKDHGMLQDGSRV